MNLKSNLSALLLSLVVLTAQADQVDTCNLTMIAKTLRTLYPATQIDDVRLAPIAGIYEVVMGKNIGYTNSEGRHFLFGHVLDMQTRQDITQQRLDELSTTQFSELPLKDAIKTVRGTGERLLAVFSDPDCPYCKNLENELVALDNVTIYTFLMPLEGLHPEAPKKAKSIWCSSNASDSWRSFMVGNMQPKGKTDCNNPVERNIQLGQKLGIDGTPTLVAADGRVMPGAASSAKIEQWISGKGDK